MIRSRPRPLLASLVLLWSATAPGAQERRAATARELPVPTVSVSRSCGLQTEDGTLWALGPGYKARFLDDGFEFTPALGAAAPRNLPLRFRLLEIGRRAAGNRIVAAPAAAAERTADGLHVRYRRGEVTEVYEVRAEGIEQSFVFATLPAGDGDLIVRGAIETELEASPAGDGSGALQFLRPGLGGVRIGAVTGIDANGRRAAGGLAFADGVLELSLPAAFVAQAALPLVLDPLIGSTILAASGYDEKEPDVAEVWSGSTVRYLVVWARVFSGGDVDIRGQRLNQDGTLFGGLLGVRTSSAVVSDLPSVAPLRLRDRGVVVWREALATNPSYIAACSLDAVTGTVSTTIQLVAGANSFGGPDVGGDGEALGDTAVAVWADVTAGRIEGCRITVAATGAVSSSGRQILSGAGSAYHSAPSIAQDCGRHGRLLIAWQSSNFGIWLAGMVVTRTLGSLGQLALTTASGPWEGTPDVSGDGLHWIVGYDRRVDSSTAPDVYCRWVTFDPVAAAAYLGPEALVDGGSGTQTGASVTLLGFSALVANRELSSTTGYGAAFVRSVDQFSCGPCEGSFVLDNTVTRDVRQVASAGHYRNGVLVWESVAPATGSGEIRARRFSEDAGVSGALWPGCGPVLEVYASCSLAGNTGFSVRLEHAEPGRPVFLLLHDSPLPTRPVLQCGTGCSFIDPFRAWFFPAGVTDSHGNAAVLLPLPSTLPPQHLEFQFGILPSGFAACAAIGLSFSRFGAIATK